MLKSLEQKLRHFRKKALRQCERSYREMQQAIVIPFEQKPWPTDKPLVSVIIPCFNYGSFIEEAIDSVLAQTFQNIEVIVVDGGSTDEATRQFLRRLQKPKTTICLRDAGPFMVGSNRNYGIRMAQGKYVCCLDADDCLKPTYLEKALFALENYNYDIVSASVEMFDDENGEPTGRWLVPRHFTLKDIVKGNRISTIAVFKKSLWELAGGYHDFGRGEDYIFEDWDLWVRMMALGARAFNIKECLMRYRQHSTESLSRQPIRPRLEKQREAILSNNQSLISTWRFAYSHMKSLPMMRARHLHFNGKQATGSKPHVTFALPYTITGGATTVQVQIAEALKEAGYEVSILVTDSRDESLGNHQADYEKITPFVYPFPQLFEKRRRWDDYLFYLLATHQTSILIIFGSRYIYSRLPQIRKRFPNLIVVDQLYNEFGHLQNNRRYASLINHHIVATPNLRKLLAEKGENDSKITFIQHGVDASVFKNRKLNRDEVKPIVIGFIGRLSKEKAPLSFVEIAAGLQDTRKKVRFLMIGNGPQGEMVKNQVNKLGLSRQFSILGFVDDIVEALKSIDILVIPSLIEGIPIIMLEAMAMGIPVVTSKVGGIPDVIQHGQNGLLADDGKVEQFTSSLSNLIEDDERRQWIAMQAQRYVLEFCSLDVMKAQYLETFLALLKITPPATNNQNLQPTEHYANESLTTSIV